MSQFKHSHRRLKWIAPACAGLFLLSPARRLGQNGTAPNNRLPAHPAAVAQPAPAAPAAMSPVSLSGPCTGDACAGDVRVPTGELKTGNDLSSLTPSVAFWTDLGNA